MAADWYRYGMGFYSAPKATMDALRRELALRPARFREAIAPFAGAGVFTVEGDQYKRPVGPDLPEDLRGWRQRKNLYVTRNCVPGDLLFSPRLVEEMRAGFESLAPFYHYLWALEEPDGTVPVN